MQQIESIHPLLPADWKWEEELKCVMDNHVTEKRCTPYSCMRRLPADFTSRTINRIVKQIGDQMDRSGMSMFFAQPYVPFF